jgi:rhamnulokinase
VFAAIDLGASSGRVIAGWVGNQRLASEEVHRFANAPVERDGHLRWDLEAIWQQLLFGLEELARRHPGVVSIGIDTWGVDYGLLDRDGQLVDDPIAYRDDRTADAIAEVDARIAPAERYARTGIAHLRFNTIFQLVADRRSGRLDRAATVVLLPDLLAHRLTGELRTEITNASTTGLLDARTGVWSSELLRRIGLGQVLLPPLEEPGVVRGTIRPELAERVGLDPATLVTTVASHDTASAVAAIPADDASFAYISCGTWSLVGMELPAPLLTDEARAANASNERGVDGRIRLLRNASGMWLLQESIRTWERAGHRPDVEQLLSEAATRDVGPTVDLRDPMLIAPGDLPTRIRARADSLGTPLGPGEAAVVRCIVDSLAAEFADTVAELVHLTGRTPNEVHLVGGASQSDLLCRRAADALGLPVVAGPVEASALGNLAVQARAHGVAPDDLDELRQWACRGEALRRYEPQATGAAT